MKKRHAIKPSALRALDYDALWALRAKTQDMATASQKVTQRYQRKVAQIDSEISQRTAGARKLIKQIPDAARGT